MPILRRLKEQLEAHRLPYEILTHRPAYTAQEVAQAQHVPGRELAKVVIARAGAQFVMAVLPAVRRLDLGKLEAMVGTSNVRVAHEHEFAPLFPECEPGAMPPFGNLFGLPLYVDRSLADDEFIVFQAGTHTETVRMRYADFAQLARPRVGDLTLMREEMATGAHYRPEASWVI
jgi:Ala-tRNA(Pro) deacylase